MSKFWQKKYISKYTGAEIDAAVAKADTVPAVTEADAGSALVVDEEGKIVAGEAGTQVEANPTLAGTEAALEGLQVGDTKYKVEAGGGSSSFARASHITVGEDTFEYLWSVKAKSFNQDYTYTMVFVTPAVMAKIASGEITGIIYIEDQEYPETKFIARVVSFTDTSSFTLTVPTTQTDYYLAQDITMNYVYCGVSDDTSNTVLIVPDTISIAEENK